MAICHVNSKTVKLKELTCLQNMSRSSTSVQISLKLRNPYREAHLLPPIFVDVVFINVTFRSHQLWTFGCAFRLPEADGLTCYAMYTSYIVPCRVCLSIDRLSSTSHAFPDSCHHAQRGFRLCSAFVVFSFYMDSPACHEDIHSLGSGANSTFDAGEFRCIIYCFPNINS